MITKALVLSLLPAIGGAPYVGPVGFGDLTLAADAIVLGRVADVVCVSESGVARAQAIEGQGARCDEGKTIARIEVEQVLRGDPGWKQLWYLAEGTWMCDATEAIPGERALFFLTQGSSLAPDGTDLGGRLARLTKGRPILFDAYHGRGKMGLVVQEDTELVRVWDDVLPPDGLSVLRAGIYWRAPLQAVISAVEQALRQRPLAMPAHPESGLPAAVAVIQDDVIVLAAFWRDGTAIWNDDTVVGGGPYYRGSVEPQEVWNLGKLDELEECHDAWSKDGLPDDVARLHIRTRFPDSIHSIGVAERAGALRSGSPEERIFQTILQRLPKAGRLAELDSLLIR